MNYNYRVIKSSTIIKNLKIFTIIFIFLFAALIAPSLNPVFAKNFNITLSQKNFNQKDNPHLEIKPNSTKNIFTFITSFFKKPTPVNLKTQTKIILKNHDQKEITNQAISTSTKSDGSLSVDIDQKYLKPGKYIIEITDTKTNETTIQDFTWGVLAINPNKSVYSTGDTALLAIAVLNEKGDMVCDAFVSLEISTPNGTKTTFTTKDGSIKVNPQCLTKELTLIPDYEAQFPITQTGKYQLTLTATTTNGIYSISDSFSAEDQPSFIVERLTATRIFPLQNYPVTIKFTPKNDFNGYLLDSVPTTFKITSPNSTIKTQNNRQFISWPITAKANQTISLNYQYDAPNISPEFFTLGPIQILDSQKQIIYQENRSWQIASDAVTETFTNIGSTAWAAPDNVFSIQIEAWGGGGGGGDGSNGYGGGGGGGGAFVAGTMVVIPGNTYPLIVGTGGSGGTGSGAGASGADTTFNSTSFIAKGGGGGSGSQGATGGSGGLASQSTGTTKSDGGNGGIGNNATSDAGGGGGGAAGPHGIGITGGNASTSIGGHGGQGDNNNGGVGGIAVNGSVGATGASNALGGGGGSGGDNATAGGAGGSPGAGGGGGEANTAVAGRGGGGQVVLTYTANNPPNTPTNSTPSNGAIGISLNPTLIGSSYSDTESDAQQASQWQIATDSDFAAVVWDTGTTGAASNTVNVGYTLSNNTLYYWHVRYQAVQGNWSNYSVGTSFTTVAGAANQAPNTPSLSLPIDTATNVSQTPTFETVATDTENNDLQYEIKICTNSSMSSGCQTFTAADTGWSGADVGTTSYSVGTTAVYILQAGNSLAVNTPYYWKTRAIDPTGSNTYSDTQSLPFSFTTLTGETSPPGTTNSFGIKGIKIKGIDFK